IVLGIANLSSDPIDRIECFVGGLAERVGGLSVVDEVGRARKVEEASIDKVGDGYGIRASLEVGALDACVLILDKE
ncbi:MAG: hypothetical protein JTT11_09945, partial [Candidatus Brockarchaeota archaeon]|nr:hypothetical protein [Candidatus Brockarchaeota archaeon]